MAHHWQASMQWSQMEAMLETDVALLRSQLNALPIWDPDLQVRLRQAESERWANADGAQTLVPGPWRREVAPEGGALECSSQVQGESLAVLAGEARTPDVDSVVGMQVYLVIVWRGQTSVPTGLPLPRAADARGERLLRQRVLEILAAEAEESIPAAQVFEVAMLTVGLLHLASGIKAQAFVHSGDKVPVSLKVKPDYTMTVQVGHVEHVGRGTWACSRYLSASLDDAAPLHLGFELVGPCRSPIVPAVANRAMGSEGEKLWLSGTSGRDGLRDLLSGMLSGFVCKIVEYPADTIKVLEQTGGNRFNGPIDCFLKTAAESGVLSLYRGLAAPLLGSMAECASLFTSYGYMKRLLGVNEEDATPVPFWKLVISGGGSGFASSCVLTPVELIKCRLQAQLNSAGSQKYKGPIDCIARTVREEGVTGLWRGNLSTLAREIPGNMAWFGVYEAGMRLVQSARGDARKKDVPLYWSALSGSAAGVAYWALPFPADTVKSKIQTDVRFHSSSFSSVFKTVVKEEGFAGLYRGCAITCLRAIPSHALVFYFYEVADRFLLQF
eukprot:Skav225549  [mRNA]  locus=scaffold81:233965:257891:+ [translate_table: standard]